MLTVEQQIVDALVLFLQDIPGITNAWDGRVTPINEAEMPAAVVYTPKTEPEEAGAMQTDHLLSVNIVFYLISSTAQSEIRALIADFYAALGGAEIQAAQDSQPVLGIKKIISIEDGGNAKKCSQAGDFIGSAQVALNITYRTARWAM